MAQLLLHAATRATRHGGAPRGRGAMQTPRHLRAMHALSSSEIRSQFLSFFNAHGHTIVPSASLIPPSSDTSLLFTNAGMVPFKQLFLGHEQQQKSYLRATSSQRCVRAGGKHNDLDQVGLTRRHHTQFEMLGNFSFGDYFKEEAIYYAWQFLTKQLALPVDRLHVTVLANDHEARALWQKIAGLPHEKIISCSEDDNFWAMGDSGPCGPCSEIFWDLGDHIKDPEERFLELWNLVFMQFSREESDGLLSPLPQRCVDTGMGLERIASVLQRVPSNYHTDQFVPILHHAAQVLDSASKGHTHRFAQALEKELDPENPAFGKNPEIQTLRILADHVRASYAMLQDGIFPSNVGRGYVLRRIIRRAIRVAQNVAQIQDGATPIVSQIMVEEYATLSGFPQMQGILVNEERAFHEMLQNGKKALDKVFLSSDSEISGQEAFKLFDTFGIPLDITQVLADEKGFSVDEKGFHDAMEDHKRKATQANITTGSSSNTSAGSNTTTFQAMDPKANTFVGYESLRVTNARVLAAWGATDPKESSFWVVLDPCPFYAEGGGQVGDRGHLVVHHSSSSRNGPLRLDVHDTKRIATATDAIAVLCSLSAPKSEPEEPHSYDESALVDTLMAPSTVVDATVDERFRMGCSVHHSATHCLQRALKQVLGDHVTQAGSFVSYDKLRFDFAHFGALSLDQLTQIETKVNEMAMADYSVETQVLKRQQAEQSGAICNFGDKYGDTVRVVSIGPAVSKEFCGGTHVLRTSSIFPFVIVSEGSVAAGTRRLECVAGMAGAIHLQAKDRVLQTIAAQLETTSHQISDKINKLQKQIKSLTSATQALGDTVAMAHVAPLVDTQQCVLHKLKLTSMAPPNKEDGCASGGATGSTVGSAELSKVLRRRAEFLVQNEPDKVHFVVLHSQIVCVANGQTDQHHAGKILQKILKKVGGKGGGNATFAQGNLPNGDTSVTEIGELLLEENNK